MHDGSVSTPKPALVTQRDAQRLPRWALLLLCGAWIVPGLVGRDPWRNADVTAFGIMSAMAEGRSSWLHPTLGGLPVEGAPLPHWVGAVFIQMLAPAIDPALAVRIPFALLLVLIFAAVWYATFHLAKTEAAQPVAFAFGGEASPIDYARAVADGSLLALLATLGLVHLGHETTPELVQAAAVASFLWALAAAPFRPWQPALVAVASLGVLAVSGAPFVACALGIVGSIICWYSAYPSAKALSFWLLAGTVLAFGLSSLTHAWAWRFALTGSQEQTAQMVRLWLWFMWPAWPLAGWTLWRWRRQWLNRHVAVPGTVVLTLFMVSVWMGGSDRALLLALPGLAILASFALPTLKRAASAGMDWFSMSFCTLTAMFIWAMYIAISTGWPTQWDTNVARLAPGFATAFNPLTFALAAVATVAWLALIRWRTGRHQHPLWKSLVLPAGGVALCWLLLMTLWLPLLDFARSSRPGIERVSAFVGHPPCIAVRQFSLAMIASWETLQHTPVDARPGAEKDTPCPVLLQVTRTGTPEASPEGWTFVGAAKRPTDRTELVSVYRR